MTLTARMRLTIWAALYWLPFACLVLYAGAEPGYLPRYSRDPKFLWLGIAIALLVLAAQTALFAFVLRLGDGTRTRGRRLVSAWLIAFPLAILWLIGLPTHMPGFVVASAAFAPTTLLLLTASVLGHFGREWYKNFRNAP
ncbi:MAG: hypothetical protein KF796_07340 [Ramlibacter sp.]|nr:hypothetical protein [Ramlibacter sp.]